MLVYEEHGNVAKVFKVEVVDWFFGLQRKKKTLVYSSECTDYSMSVGFRTEAKVKKAMKVLEDLV